MPTDPHDNADGTLETGVAHLPAPTRAPERSLAQANVMDVMEQPALSDEELRARQAAFGTRRRPVGPLLNEGPAGGANALDAAANVPETDVSETVEIDPDSSSIGLMETVVPSEGWLNQGMREKLRH